VLEGAGEKDVAVLVGCSVEGIGRGRGVGEGFEKGGGGKAVIPLGVVGELFGGEGTGRDMLGERVFRNDEGAEEDAFGLAGWVVGVGADAFDTCGCGLLELLAEDGGVDA